MNFFRAQRSIHAPRPRRRSAFAPVDLDGVLRDAAELYEPVVEEKGMAVRLCLIPAGPVPGDRDLLLEAVGNLLDNAIKFSPAETDITLSLCDAPGGVCIRVADQGPGIALAERERVLQRFYRTQKSRTVEGSGLGLSLVAAVAALHGFRLRIGGSDSSCVVEIICTQADDGQTAASAPNTL